jgi:hypothetical protein
VTKNVEKAGLNELGSKVKKVLKMGKIIRRITSLRIAYSKQKLEIRGQFTLKGQVLI